MTDHNIDMTVQGKSKLMEGGTKLGFPLDCHCELLQFLIFHDFSMPIFIYQDFASLLEPWYTIGESGQWLDRVVNAQFVPSFSQT